MRALRTSDGRLSSGAFVYEVNCRYVLPQHYLFQLAECPPDDLPALLSIFRTVPPVIKRRANELLDEIRAGESGSADGDGSRKTMTGLSRTEDYGPVDDPQRDNCKKSGMVSTSARFAMC